MTIDEVLKKRILYRSNHRGSKEMDLLLGNFVVGQQEVYTVQQSDTLGKISQY